MALTWSNIIGANQATYNTNNAAQADDGDEYRVAITAAGATPVYSLSAILTVQTGATVIANFSPANLRRHLNKSKTMGQLQVLTMPLTYLQ